MGSTKQTETLVLEAFGATVSWDGQNSIVIVETVQHKNPSIVCFNIQKSRIDTIYDLLQSIMRRGSTLEEAMEMAQEALGVYLVSLIEDGKEPAHPTDIGQIHPESGVASYVSVNLDHYRRNTKAVKKTLSIPKWLSDEAEKRNISLSKVLQEGLKEQLGL